MKHLDRRYGQSFQEVIVVVERFGKFIRDTNGRWFLASDFVRYGG